MDTTEKIRTRCPICRSKYMVPATLIGHHARCAKCKATFLVAEHNHHPTEEDILRWLNEDIEEYEFAPRPRIIHGDSTSSIPTKVGDLERSEFASTSRLKTKNPPVGVETEPHP